MNKTPCGDKAKWHSATCWIWTSLNFNRQIHTVDQLETSPDSANLYGNEGKWSAQDKGGGHVVNA